MKFKYSFKLIAVTAGLPRGWTSPDPMGVVDYLNQIYPWMDQEYGMLNNIFLCACLKQTLETNSMYSNSRTPCHRSTGWLPCLVGCLAWTWPSDRYRLSHQFPVVCFFWHSKAQLPISISRPPRLMQCHVYVSGLNFICFDKKKFGMESYWHVSFSPFNHSSPFFSHLRG